MFFYYLTKSTVTRNSHSVWMNCRPHAKNIASCSVEWSNENINSKCKHPVQPLHIHKRWVLIELNKHTNGMINIASHFSQTMAECAPRQMIQLFTIFFGTELLLYAVFHGLPWKFKWILGRLNDKFQRNSRSIDNQNNIMIVQLYAKQFASTDCFRSGTSKISNKYVSYTYILHVHCTHINRINLQFDYIFFLTFYGMTRTCWPNI